MRARALLRGRGEGRLGHLMGGLTPGAGPRRPVPPRAHAINLGHSRASVEHLPAGMAESDTLGRGTPIDAPAVA